MLIKALLCTNKYKNVFLFLEQLTCMFHFAIYSRIKFRSCQATSYFPYILANNVYSYHFIETKYTVKIVGMYWNITEVCPIDRITVGIDIEFLLAYHRIVTICSAREALKLYTQNIKRRRKNFEYRAFRSHSFIILN